MAPTRRTAGTALVGCPAMTRLITIASALALTFTFAACKSKSGEGGGGGGDQPKAPTMTVNEADWVMKDLKATAPLINISMKVPKDAKLEKNGNGGVDITLNDFYMLTVSNLAVSNVAEAIKSDKSLTVENTSYINPKVLTEEPNGFIYTIQMKTEENGNKYEPEVHFAFYVEKDGAIYSIQDQKKSFSTPGSAYSDAIAKKIYAIVKGSAKSN
jgi:hypothetical protein